MVAIGFVFSPVVGVAAWLCEHAKAADRRLVVSADLLRQVIVPAGLVVGEGESLLLRGRQEWRRTHWIQALPG